MPLYNLDEYKAVVRANGYFKLNARRIEKNLENLDWSDQDLLEFLLNLDPRDFQKTIKDRAITNSPIYVEDNLIVADQYEVDWNEEKKMRSKVDCTVILSLKIAILKDENGNYAGVVTFHTSG